jgi:anti-sigma B factor antagonist
MAAAIHPATSPEGVPFWLRIVASDQGKTRTIEVEGEWDLAQRDAARDAIGQVLERRSECLVFDLSRLTFIDSSGVHGLIDTSNRCVGQGTRLVIVPGPPAVQRVFDLCGVGAILPFAADDGRVRAARPRSA